MEESRTTGSEADAAQNSQEGDGQKEAFSIEKLRLPQNYTKMVGVEKVITTVPVRKPGRQDFFRVHPGDDWYLETPVLELKEERETYLVERSLWAELSGETAPKALFTTINRQGGVSIWTIRLPGEDGRLDPWNTSALEAAEMAKEQWVRVAANMGLGAYDIYVATGSIPEPEWPDTTFEELLKIAFKDRFIRTLDHPVIRRLRGEI